LKAFKKLIIMTI